MRKFGAGPGRRGRMRGVAPGGALMCGGVAKRPMTIAMPTTASQNSAGRSRLGWCVCKIGRLATAGDKGQATAGASHAAARVTTNPLGLSQPDRIPPSPASFSGVQTTTIVCYHILEGPSSAPSGTCPL